MEPKRRVHSQISIQDAACRFGVVPWWLSDLENLSTNEGEIFSVACFQEEALDTADRRIRHNLEANEMCLLCDQEPENY